VKYLWVLAGANGSGKSTFYRKFLADTGMPFINADEIAKVKFPEKTIEANQKAQAEAHRLYHEHLDKGDSFCYETVFSHHSKIEFLERASQLGYTINLGYIHLEDPDLNVLRVSQRVSEGGHDVSEDKIRSRITRTMDHIKKALVIVDEADIYENSNDENPFALKASIKNGKFTFLEKPTPVWLSELTELVG
jgi:predicted ABC-type ATPase